MINNYTISPDDPDLNAYEKYIADFHQQLSYLKIGEEPSYENADFFEEAITVEYLPGNDDGYCVFAASLFSEDLLNSYKLDAHLMLQKSYGKKADKTVDSIKNDFLRLEDKPSLIAELKGLSKRCCQLWDYIIYKHLSDPLAKITEDDVSMIIEQSDQIGDELIKLSLCEDMELGGTKALSNGAKYDWLAKAVLQLYEGELPLYAQLFTQVCVNKLGNELVEYDHDIIKVVDLILTHRLALKSDCAAGRKKVRKEMLQLPAEYIYVRLNGNLKADSTKAAYRWLFIKAWAYSYLKINPMSLSDLARVIAKDDRFFYRDSMHLLSYCKSEAERNDLIDKRFLDLKNELSKWNKNEDSEGFINGKLIGMSQRGS
ncbi:conserved hypothetical protein [Vibrio crassostreae]|nr:conserved hypothetical protein [Vibrio crassostreae]CAK2099601.1 conserved hypothetical protein [Vibrio crassostreae]CAK2105633.1 conserved hypothetical protein [Vibrio crassostreae]CAK2106414.1 conserved hypothetical protein [Vibrio crassostreae]CAK2108105.1 conserved hypothetical protein [Vibrio crassostreae]